MTENNFAGAGNEIRAILADLNDDDLLHLQPGERIWRLYCFRTMVDGASLRHRIYTKQKADGRLSLITFAEQAGPRPDDAPIARSNIARVPDLAPADLDRLITAVQGQADSTSCETLDLSDRTTLDEQWAWLEQHCD